MPLTLVPPRKGRSRFWRLRGTVRGKSIDETTGVESREHAEAIRIKRESQILEESIFGPRVSRTFQEATVSYIETVKPGHTQVEALIGRERREGGTSWSLLDAFGPMKVSAIDQVAVDRVMRERFPNAAPATIQRQLLTPLISVLTFAAARGWRDRPQLWRPKPTKGRSRWATYEEADKLLSSASPHTYRLILFLMMTGARMSEALELDWSDVNLPERWVVFRNTKRSGEDRGVPLHLQLVAMLGNLRYRSGPVFLNNRGRPYAEREGGGQIKTAWAATLRRSGIADIRPHDLRHTFSTWLTLAGTHEQVRDEIMGHASTSMGRRYSHIPRESLLEAVDKLPHRAVPEPGQRWQAGRRKRAV